MSQHWKIEKFPDDTRTQCISYIVETHAYKGPRLGRLEMEAETQCGFWVPWNRIATNPTCKGCCAPKQKYAKECHANKSHKEIHTVSKRRGAFKWVGLANNVHAFHVSYWTTYYSVLYDIGDMATRVNVGRE